jgi:hypothetical protein
MVRARIQQHTFVSGCSTAGCIATSLNEVRAEFVTRNDSSEQKQEDAGDRLVKRGRAIRATALE